MGTQVNTKRKVSDCFKDALRDLIVLAGYDPNNDAELKLFVEIGGGTKAGISWLKINWVLKDGLIPREDFLYCLAEIAVAVKGRGNYIKEGINNPKRYELNRFLLMCGYIPQLGNVFPVSEKFRRFRGYDEEKYVEAVPDIFWNLDIPFGEALEVFNVFVPKNGLEIRISSDMSLFLKRYIYDNGVLKPSEVDEEDQSTEAFSFKLTNTERKMRFATIEAIRQINTSLIPITLINGNWVDIVGTIWEDYCHDLAIENFYNYLDLEMLDEFFHAYEGAEKMRKINILNINKLLMANPTYQEIYRRLTLGK